MLTDKQLWPGMLGAANAARAAKVSGRRMADCEVFWIRRAIESPR